MEGMDLSLENNALFISKIEYQKMVDLDEVKQEHISLFGNICYKDVPFQEVSINLQKIEL